MCSTVSMCGWTVLVSNDSDAIRWGFGQRLALIVSIWVIFELLEWGFLPSGWHGNQLCWTGWGGSVGTWAEGGCAGRVGSLPRYLCRNLILYANFLTIRVSLLNMQTTNSNRNLTNPTTSSFNVGNEPVSQAKQTLTTTLTADRLFLFEIQLLRYAVSVPPPAFFQTPLRNGGHAAPFPLNAVAKRRGRFGPIT